MYDSFYLMYILKCVVIHKTGQNSRNTEMTNPNFQVGEVTKKRTRL
jgi:hypothetical protein